MFISLEKWSASYDGGDHCYNTQTSEPCAIYPVCSTSLVVRLSRKFQTVYIRGSTMHCDCSGHRGRCIFTATVKSHLEDEENELIASFRSNLTSELSEINYEQTSISTQSIEFCE